MVKVTSSKFLISNIIFLLIAILPLGLLVGSLIINTLTFLIAFFFIFEILTKKKIDFLYDWSFFLLIFLWISFLINLFFSQNASLGLPRSIGFIKFIFFVQAIKYIFLFKEIGYKKLILQFWLVIFIIVSFDILIEYSSGQNILGFKSDLPGRLGSFLGYEYKIGAFYFGFAILSFSTIYTYFTKDYKIIFLLVILFLIISFFVGERSNFLKILICFTIILTLFFNKYLKQVISFVILCLIIFGSIIYNNENLKYRYLAQWNIENINDNNYILHYKTAIFVFQKFPVFGSGIKNFRIEVKNVIKENYENDQKYNNVRILTTHPHQINFEILSETGIFGYFCFLIFFILSFKKAFRELIKGKNIFLMSSSIYCLIYINPVLPSGSFFTTYGATIFWTIYAIMITNIKSNKKVY